MAWPSPLGGEVISCFLSLCLCLSGERTRPTVKNLSKKKCSDLGPAVGVMAVSLDSHVVDCSSSPGPSSLNSRWAHVHVCPRS